MDALIALACSGPGAMAHIEDAERLGWITYGISIAIAVATAVWIAIRRRKRPSRVLLVALAHPGLWWSARGGDCGCSMSLMVFAGTLLVVFAAVFALWRARVNH